MDMTIFRTLLATLALSAAASAARAETEFLYNCGQDLGFVVTTYPESGKGRFDGNVHVDITPDGKGAWVNEANEIQFWPEEDVPTLFVGSEQFSCAPFEDDPGMHAGDEPADSTLQNTADLDMTPYASVRGWDVVSMASGADFVGCSGSNSQDAGFLILQKKDYGWELRVPADQTEGFEGGIITLDGKKVDAQFGFTPEGAGEAGLDDGFVAALKNGKVLTTQINGAKAVKWQLTGSAAVVTKIEECFQRKGVVK